MCNHVWTAENGTLKIVRDWSVPCFLQNLGSHNSNLREATMSSAYRSKPFRKYSRLYKEHTIRFRTHIRVENRVQRNDVQLWYPQDKCVAELEAHGPWISSFHVQQILRMKPAIPLVSYHHNERTNIVFTTPPVSLTFGRTRTIYSGQSVHENNESESLRS